jgi:hypothetical protein
MAASMMMAPVGSMLKVSGSRITMPPAEPMPGRTPTRVPIRHPIKA